MQRALEDSTKLERRFGQLAPTIRRRLVLLKAVESLEEAMAIQSLGIHLLTGDRKGQYAVKLDGRNRLIVVPCSEHGHLMSVDDMNRREIAALIIRELVVDYH